MAGVGGMILLFPVSVFWAVLFGFWLPGLAAMQLYFPVLREQYGLTVQQIPRPTPAPSRRPKKNKSGPAVPTGGTITGASWRCWRWWRWALCMRYMA